MRMQRNNAARYYQFGGHGHNHNHQYHTDLLKNVWMPVER